MYSEGAETPEELGQGILASLDDNDFEGFKDLSPTFSMVLEMELNSVELTDFGDPSKEEMKDYTNYAEKLRENPNAYDELESNYYNYLEATFHIMREKGQAAFDFDDLITWNNNWKIEKLPNGHYAVESDFEEEFDVDGELQVGFIEVKSKYYFDGSYVFGQAMSLSSDSARR